MTPYEKQLHAIDSCKSLTELEALCEDMAYDDNITHTEYTELYGKALTKYNWLLDIILTAQSLQGEYNNMKEEEGINA